MCAQGTIPPGAGCYTRDQLEDVFLLAYSAFRAAINESYYQLLHSRREVPDKETFWVEKYPFSVATTS